MENFWNRLPKPFFALAPLEDVTDAAFRRLIAKYGKPAPTRRDSSWRGGPDVMFTEFTSADGLVLADTKGRAKLEKKLLFHESERPIVAQIFSSIPENIEEAARFIADLRFDGVDINMGCPDRVVEKTGCGAALIKTPSLARELIAAAKKSGLPVSVKTRIGYAKDELETWLPELLAESPAAVTLHARTRKEMSDVPAHWDRITRAVHIRDAMKSETLIIGNGDAESIVHARYLAAETECDGIMLGRAIFGNPWLFLGLRNPNISMGFVNLYMPSPQERIAALLEHLELFQGLLGGSTPFATMKKHFKSYISGWHGAKELRIQLMKTTASDQATAILRTHLYTHQ